MPEWLLASMADTLLKISTLGAVLGFIARITEHGVYGRCFGDVGHAPTMRFGLVILSQCLLVGVTIAYASGLFLAQSGVDQHSRETLALLLAAAFSFMAPDLRDLIRRLTQV